MTDADVARLVRELDPGAVVRPRADGGFVLGRDGVEVGICATSHAGAMRRHLEDGVIGLKMILVSRRLEALTAAAGAEPPSSDPAKPIGPARVRASRRAT